MKKIICMFILGMLLVTPVYAQTNEQIVRQELEKTLTLVIKLLLKQIEELQIQLIVAIQAEKNKIERNNFIELVVIPEPEPTKPDRFEIQRQLENVGDSSYIPARTKPTRKCNEGESEFRVNSVYWRCYK